MGPLTERVGYRGDSLGALWFSSLLLSLSPSFFLSIVYTRMTYVTIYPSIYLSICPPVHLHFCLYVMSFSLDTSSTILYTLYIFYEMFESFPPKLEEFNLLRFIYISLILNTASRLCINVRICESDDVTALFRTIESCRDLPSWW